MPETDPITGGVNGSRMPHMAAADAPAETPTHTRPSVGTPPAIGAAPRAKLPTTQIGPHAVYQLMVSHILIFVVTLFAGVGYVSMELGKVPTLSVNAIGPAILFALPLFALSAVLWGIPGLLGGAVKKGFSYWVLCSFITVLFVADIVWICYRLVAQYVL